MEFIDAAEVSVLRYLLLCNCFRDVTSSLDLSIIFDCITSNSISIYSLNKKETERYVVGEQLLSVGDLHRRVWQKTNTNCECKN